VMEGHLFTKEEPLLLNRCWHQAGHKFNGLEGIPEQALSSCSQIIFCWAPQKTTFLLLAFL
jgi:hypothetical protein